MVLFEAAKARIEELRKEGDEGRKVRAVRRARKRRRR
jgi:hypothetical protein